jgi:hypothetical protein
MTEIAPDFVERQASLRAPHAGLANLDDWVDQSRESYFAVSRGQLIDRFQFASQRRAIVY